MLTYKLAKTQFNQENIVSRILVIDKTPIIPFAVKKLLTHYPYMNVVGQCHDRYSVMSCLKKSNPSTIVIDPDLPFLEGLDAIKQLQRHKSDLKFIIFTHEHNGVNLDEYIRLNVQGIVLKESNINTLLSAIHAVCRGFTFMDKKLLPHATDDNCLINPKKLSHTLALPRISPREKQILGLIAKGLRNKEIAEKLTISVKTVESHRLNLMKKLDAHSIVDLMRWAIRFNIA